MTKNEATKAESLILAIRNAGHVLAAHEAVYFVKHGSIADDVDRHTSERMKIRLNEMLNLLAEALS